MFLILNWDFSKSLAKTINFGKNYFSHIVIKYFKHSNIYNKLLLAANLVFVIINR